MKKDTIKKFGAGFFALALAVAPLASSVRTFADGETGKYTIKLTAQNEKSEGAKFKIVEKELINSDGSSVESNKDLGFSTIGANNESIYKVDKKGVYTIKQVKRAPGYILNEAEAKVEFPIMKDGVESAEQVAEVSVKQNLLLKDLVFAKLGESKVTSTEANGGFDGLYNSTRLEGVQFKLTRTHTPKEINDNNIVSKWEAVTEEGINATSNEQGMVTFKDLKEGIYKLEETATIDGYDVLKGEKYFAVTYGTNGIPSVSPAAPGEANAGPKYEYKYDTFILGEKADADRFISGEGVNDYKRESSSERYSYIANYKTPVLDKKIIDPISGEKVTEINTNVLVDYKYVLRVELPSNWDKNKTFKIEDILNENLNQPKVEKVEYKTLLEEKRAPLPAGTEHVNTDSPTKYTIESTIFDNNVVTIDGNKLSLDLIKDIKNQLVGVETSEVGTSEVGTNAFIEITLSTKVKAETVLNRIPNNFTIEYDNPNGEGTKKITSNDVFTNITKGSVEFIKTESDGVTPLKGAEFKLYKLDENGTVEIDGQKYSEAIDPKTNQAYPTYITGEDGKVSQTDLPFATYAFKEVKAPEGYRLMNDAIKFTIDKDNTNIKLDNVKNYRIGEIVINTGTVGVALATIAGIGTMATGFVLNKRKKEDK